MIELWKDITGYEGLYQVSNCGRIKSLIHNYGIRKYKHTNEGYATVALSKDGKNTTRSVHKIVALAFISNHNNLPMLNHIDEDKDNNAVTNLEWCDCKYNNNYGTRTERSSKSRGYPVAQYDKAYNLIQTFDSVSMASKILHISMSLIASCCKRPTKTGYGYKFEYIAK